MLAMDAKHERLLSVEGAERFTGYGRCEPVIAIDTNLLEDNK